METEKESPYWEDKYKINSKYVKEFIGKNCHISFKKPFAPSFYSKFDARDARELKVKIKGYDGYFLNVLIPVKNKNYSCLLAIDNISAILSEENN